VLPFCGDELRLMVDVNAEDVESPSINFSLIRESPVGIVLERF
jgi:hypothetical protein